MAAQVALDRVAGGSVAGPVAAAETARIDIAISEIQRPMGRERIADAAARLLGKLGDGLPVDGQGGGGAGNAFGAVA